MHRRTKWCARVALAVTPLTLGLACQRLERGSDGGRAVADTDVLSPEPGAGTFLSGAETSQLPTDPPAQIACDPVTQSGCGDDQKCTSVQTGSQTNYQCVAERGVLDVGETCSPSLSDGLDRCRAGSVCLGTEPGVCRQHCTRASDCDNGVCVDDPLDRIQHCASDCNPLAPVCPGELQCRRRGDRYICIDIATELSSGGVAAECSAELDIGCAEGLRCLSAELTLGCTTQSCCTPLCDLSEADTCPAPLRCNPALLAPAPGFETIGACFVES